VDAPARVISPARRARARAPISCSSAGGGGANSEKTDLALAARLFTAGLYGLMAQWHLAPGSFRWEAAAAALAGRAEQK
jgi:hypothetical protein